MATYRKRGRTWRAEIARKGLRYSATFDTKAEAEAWAAKREAEVLAGLRGLVVPHTMREALAAYRERVCPGRRGGRWESIRLLAFERQFPALLDRLMDEVSPDDIAHWRDARLREVGPASVRREMGLLRGLFTIAKREWRWTAHNPVREVRLPAKPPARDRVIADDERDAVVAALGYAAGRPISTRSQEVAVGLLLALETGMRAGEVFGLEWDRVRLRERFLTLRRTKNGDARHVPLSTRACALLEAMPGRAGPVFRVTPASADSLFRKARARAGLSGFTFHDSRATALTRLARKIDVLDLARMIGHRNPGSLMIYYRASPTEIAARLG